jgi:hypothetical protein
MTEKGKKMRVLSNLFLSILIISVLISCNGNGGNGENEQISTDIISNPNTSTGKSDLSKLPKIEFEEKIHDFGKVIEGEKVTYSFKFKNVGSSPLLISDVNASCGCTATKYPKTPIQPGKGDVLRVTFDSEKRKGFQNKSITVTSNTQPNKTIIRIKAMVYSPEQ